MKNLSDKIRARKICTSLAMLALVSNQAEAQVAPPRVAVPDADHVLMPPSITPLPAAAPALPQATQTQVLSQAKLRFDQVRIVGAKSVPQAEIAALFAPLKGREISAADLKPALDAVNALYVAAGYPLGRALIPSQRIQGGVLVVEILEGFVQSITVQSDDAKAKALVTRIAAPLLAEHPLTRATLERVILLIQDKPGMTLGSKFEAMDPKTGGTHLVLAPVVQPVTLSLRMDNRANLTNLPFQPYLTAAVNDYFGMGDRVAFTALLSPYLNEYGFYDLALSSDVTDDGLNMGLDGSWAQTIDTEVLRPFIVQARSSRLSYTARYPLLRSQNENLSLLGTAYYSGAIYGLAANTSLGTFAHDANLALQAGVDYNRIFSPTLGFAATLRLTQGVSSFDNEPHTRLHTIPGFDKARAEANLAWQPMDKVTVKLAAMGQYSPDSLVAAEQVPFGGFAYGRGFNPSEIEGNSGLGFSVQPEYKINVLPDYSLTPYVLFDYAKTYAKPSALEPAGELVSTGGGVRIGLANLATLTLEMDKPINRVPFESRNKDPHYYVGVDIGVDDALALMRNAF